MFQTRIKIILDHYGFKKYTKRAKLMSGPVTFIYVMKTSPNVHLHVSNSPVRYIRKYNSWRTKGNVERLPRPIQRLLSFKRTSEPTKYLEVYYKENCSNLDAIDKSINYVTKPVVRLPIEKTDKTNIIEVRVSEDPDFYYLIRFKTGRSKSEVLSHFTYRSLSNLLPEPKSKSQKYIDWSIRNQKQIWDKDYIVKYLVVDKTLDEAALILREYNEEIKGTNLKFWNYV